MQRPGHSDDAHWLRVLERAEREGHLPAELRVQLYSDGTYLHGTLGCPSITESHVMTPHQALAAPTATWCDCRGWLSTRAGELLSTLSDFYHAQDQEADGVLDTTWAQVWRRLRDGTVDARGWRNGDVELSEQRQLTRIAHETIARRSAALLDRDVLERSLAAQGITVAVTPHEAVDLHRWANEHRIDERRDLRALSLYAPFEHALDLAMRSPGTVLVAILGDPRQRSGFDSDLLPEVALLAWVQGLDTRTTTFLHLRRASGDGLRTLHPWSSRILVAACDETDPDVLEVVRTLWEDRIRNEDTTRHLGRRGADDVASLDELVATARML
jgi:hypothetical protein